MTSPLYSQLLDRLPGPGPKLQCHTDIFVNCYNSPSSFSLHYYRDCTDLLFTTNQNSINIFWPAVRAFLDDFDEAVLSSKCFGDYKLCISYKRYDVQLQLTVRTKLGHADLKPQYGVESISITQLQYQVLEMQRTKKLFQVLHNGKQLDITDGMETPFRISSAPHDGYVPKYKEPQKTAR